MNRDEKKKLIYNLMIGSYDLSKMPQNAELLVKNEMASGCICDELYSRVYQANRRVCDKLGVEEDEDMEMMINSLLEASEYLATRMYEYGTKQELLMEFDKEEWRQAVGEK